MKTEHLSEFLLLANTLNFHAAAEQTFTSDSALSRHIALLEKELGFALFTRSTQKVELTPLGKEFFSRVSPLVTQMDSLVDDLKMKAIGYDQALTIGVPYYAISDYLGMAPAVFSGTNPKTALNYYVGRPQDIISALCSDKTDAILITDSPYFNRDDYSVIRLFKEPFIAIMSPDNPLSDRKVLKLKDLEGQTFLYEDTDYHRLLWRDIADAFEKDGQKKPSVKMYPIVESVLSACRSGEGINIAGWNLRTQVHYGLVYVPIESGAISRNISLVYKNRHTHKALPAFIQSFSDIKEYGWMDSYPDWCDMQ